MPNILLTSYCNLECSYCFAWNKNNIKKELSLFLFLLYLKHLRNSNINEIRLLWWEPLLHSNIKEFLNISFKWWFNILIFSNLAFSTDYVESIFWQFGSNFFSKLTININLNEENFYLKWQLNNIKNNIEFLKKRGSSIIISTMLFQDLDTDFIFNFARDTGVNRVKFKPLNWKEYSEITSNRNYWKFVFNIIKKYSNDFEVSFSCWLSKKIFSVQELEEIDFKYNLKLKFGCFANWGKYDIWLEGDIFRCFPLRTLYSWINLKDYYKYRQESVISLLNYKVDTSYNIGNCLGWKIL